MISKEAAWRIQGRTLAADINASFRGKGSTSQRPNTNENQPQMARAVGETYLTRLYTYFTITVTPFRHIGDFKDWLPGVSCSAQ